MSKARLIITAVVDEKRTKSAVARDYDVSRYWVQQLVQRYLAEGESAFEPRSRRPHSSPQMVPAAVEDEIVRLRKELSRQGLDAGADTIRTHLARRTPRSQTSFQTAPPSVSTIWRILARRGLVTPQPHKRPRSSWRRFEAEQPNERWQADTTHWQLADGTPVEILNLLDDHSRLALACVPRRTITGPDVLHAFQGAFVRWESPPACSPTTGQSSRASPAAAAGLASRSSSAGSASGSTTPAPTTRRPRARSSASSKPRRSGSPRSHRPTPSQACSANSPGSAATTTTRSDRTGPWTAGPPGMPTRPDPRPPRPAPTSTRTACIRHDRVDQAGTVTLRYNSRLHHIGVGRLHAGTRITLLVDDLHIRVIDRHTGELLRELTLDPHRNFQPRGVPPGPPKKNP